MRAVTYSDYGGPEQLRLVEKSRPKPGKGQVLVRVAACGLNGSDKEFLTGRPAYARLYGVRRPRISVLGSDIAGVIEELGADVDGFSVGDRVLADNFELFGGLAEYAVLRADRVMALPDEISFRDAACLPQSAAIAWAGVHDVGKVQAGEHVLVNGAGGAGGVLAVQLAKLAGANVTAVDRADTHDSLRALGAYVVIDHRTTDFASGPTKYDLIFDFFATRPARAILPVLTENGRYLAVGGPVPIVLNLLVMGWLRGRLARKRVGILAAPPDKARVGKVMERVLLGEVKTVIGGTYSLENAANAFDDMIDGRITGKVVVEP